METPTTTLSLPDALKGAGVSYGELATSLEVAPSTAWRWCSPGYRYRSSQPTAAQLAAIGERLRLGASEVRALADWYAVRARGGL
jgi:hypothetical protein